MENQFSRTERLLGKENMEKLSAARVCIFGIGGVGGYVAEALTRSGVGHLELVDNDVVCLSNLNRQIIATHQTLGQYKVDVMKERILSINPEAEVVTGKFPLCFRRKQAVRPLSAVWEPGTNWILLRFRWRISIRPASARWRK